jgi:hypothetical protein
MEEDDADPAVALFATEAETVPAPSPTGERPPPRPQPIAAVNHAATPFSMARVGAYLEDEGDPPAFASQATEVETALAPSHAGERSLPRPQPIAAVNHAATPFSMARLGAYVEDEGDPLAPVFTTPTTDAATTCTWSPLARTPPAIVNTIASTLFDVAKEGHQEDDDYPVARRWTLATSSSNERAALASKTSLELEDEGGRASAFLPQVVFVAFRAGIG